MPLILTDKAIEREKARLHSERELREEHHRLALEHAALLDFVYLAAASKRVDNTYSNDRDSLRDKASEILDSIDL